MYVFLTVKLNGKIRTSVFTINISYCREPTTGFVENHSPVMLSLYPVSILAADLFIYCTAFIRKILVTHKRVVRLCILTFTLFLLKVGLGGPAESSSGRSLGCLAESSSGRSLGNPAESSSGRSITCVQTNSF